MRIEMGLKMVFWDLKSITRPGNGNGNVILHPHSHPENRHIPNPDWPKTVPAYPARGPGPGRKAAWNKIHPDPKTV